MRASARRPRPARSPITAVWPGRPYPLGATWDGEGVNFALFSRARREGRAVPLRRRAAATSCQRIALRERTDHVWHCYLPEARPGHALRLSRARPLPARGGPPLQPAQAAARPLRQRPRRPAALERRALRLHASGSKREDLSFDRRDSAAGMPKCRVLDPAFTWGDDRRPARAVARHRDLRAARARLHDAPPRRAARSCAAPTPALASAPVIDHLKRLGVTTVELLPVHAFIDDRHLVETGPAQLLGLQHARLLRARDALLRVAARSPSSRRW